MSEWAQKAAKHLLQQQLQQLCAKDITEEGLLTMKALIDNYLRNEQKYTEPAEEFGSTRFDFDDWLHDPGK